MVGSTALAESLDPEDFREILSAYQHACARAVERYDGWIAQWAGDGLLAYFGYPRAHEDDAHRAVHAALAIVEEIARLKARIQVRIGLHSGVVIAGETGTGDALLQRGIVGTTPHIAKRLEAIAPPGTILIGDSTRELVETHFELAPEGERELRGVAQPISVYRVLRFTGGRLDRRPLKPMVGRDAELARLVTAWERAAGGRGAIVHIPGEAGIGKSRLVGALTDHVGAAQIWQCSAHHRSSSLYPVIQALGAEPPRRPDLTPLDARAAILRDLEALVLADPKLLVVEDLHWADPTTIELLGRIATRLPAVAVLCVATYRPEFQPPWPPPTRSSSTGSRRRRPRDGPRLGRGSRPLGRRRRPTVRRGDAQGGRRERRRPAHPAGSAHATPRAAARARGRDRHGRGARPRLRPRPARRAHAAGRRARAGSPSRT